MSTRIGARRHELVIEQLGPVDDGAGGTTEGWPAVDSVEGSVRPLSAGEKYTAARIHERISHRLKFPFWPGLSSTKHRIRFGTRLFLLREVLDVDERGIEHSCYAEEVVGEVT